MANLPVGVTAVESDTIGSEGKLPERECNNDLKASVTFTDTYIYKRLFKHVLSKLHCFLKYNWTLHIIQKIC